MERKDFRPEQPRKPDLTCTQTCRPVPKDATATMAHGGDYYVQHSLTSLTCRRADDLKIGRLLPKIERSTFSPVV